MLALFVLSPIAVCAQTANLSVFKTGPGTAAVGANLTYTITVVNNGPNAATGVTVTDVLPPGVNFVPAGSTAGCASNAGTVTCPIATSINSGGNVVVTIVANSTVSGAITNVVGVVANEADSAMSNNSASAATTISGGSPPPIPANLVATATTTTQIGITWSASTGATSYQLERSSLGSGYTPIGYPTVTSYTDTVSSGTTYVYQVRAVSSGGTSAPSNKDLSTTIIFFDEPVTAGVTTIKAQHVIELRQAVNAVRVAAALAASSWTDVTLSVGVTLIKKAHVDELRSAVAAARIALGFSDPAFTDPTLTVGVTAVKKIHLDELRQRVK